MAITLKYPITVDGKNYASLSVRRPKGRDMRAMASHLDGLSDDKGAQIRGNLAMLALITDTSDKVIDELDQEDITALSEAMASFFPPAVPGSGEAS